MRLDIQKIDERIKKLEEIRRIAADPEMVAMLLDFIMAEDARSEPAQVDAVATKVQAHKDEISSLVGEVVDGTDQQPGGSLWGRRRG